MSSSSKDSKSDKTSKPEVVLHPSPKPKPKTTTSNSTVKIFGSAGIHEECGHPYSCHKEKAVAGGYNCWVKTENGTGKYCPCEFNEVPTTPSYLTWQDFSARCRDFEQLMTICRDLTVVDADETLPGTNIPSNTLITPTDIVDAEIPNANNGLYRVLTSWELRQVIYGVTDRIADLESALAEVQDRVKEGEDFTEVTTEVEDAEYLAPWDIQTSIEYMKIIVDYLSDAESVVIWPKQE